MNPEKLSIASGSAGSDERQPDWGVATDVREALIEAWAAIFEAELRGESPATVGTPGGLNRG